MGNYNGILGFAISQIQSNPNVRNNPQFQEMIQAIENNDSQRGEAIANNILKNYGVTKEAALGRAVQMFNLPR